MSINEMLWEAVVRERKGGAGITSKSETTIPPQWTSRQKLPVVGRALLDDGNHTRCVVRSSESVVSVRFSLFGSRLSRLQPDCRSDRISGGIGKVLTA
jgi:hypothetical protein